MPGQVAHKKMAQFGRKFDFNHANPPKSAGVMILLYPKNEKIYFALIQRQGHPKDPHQYQISLPGGKQEENEGLKQTAIRETYEEIGVPMESIQPLASLSTVFVAVSNFLIYPFVGYVEQTPTFTTQPEEVQELLEIPIADMLDDSIIQRTDINVRGVTLKSVPYFALANKVVWGATAMILNEFREIIRSFS